MKHPQQILLALSKSFLEYLPTFIKNLIAFNRNHLSVHILFGEVLDEQDKLWLKEFEDYHNVDIKLHYIASELRSELEQKTYTLENAGKDSMSLRLYLNKLNLTGRLLYLDLDILVTGKFDELFDDAVVDLKGNEIGAVADSFLCYKSALNDGRTFRETLSSNIADLPFNHHENFYFNSGVMLLDCDALKQSNQWLEHIAELKDLPVYPDQDYLNKLHLGKVTDIGSQYNYLSFHLLNTRVFFYHHGWNKKVSESYKQVNGQSLIGRPLVEYVNHQDQFKKIKPVFLHFAGKQKQWNSSAREFVDFFELFKQPLKEVLKQPVEYYEQLISQIWIDYGYAPFLNDMLDEDLKSLSKEKIKKYNKGLAFSFNPLFLNTKIFATGGLSNLINNALTSKRREKLNAKIYAEINQNK